MFGECLRNGFANLALASHSREHHAASSEVHACLPCFDSGEAPVITGLDLLA
jgi:hypothetical protein